MYRWLLALSFVAATAQAQTGPGTIDPGMTRAQVIERLGKPATVRNYQGSTYLMYSNNCGKTCGMQDIVILDHDAVIDAVFRSPNRHYSGTSSSPEATRANSRTQRNQPLQAPSSVSAPVNNAVTTTLPQPPRRNPTTAIPADSARTPTSRPPRDSAASRMSRPPADSAMAPAAAGPVPYGKPPTAPPPADSANSSMSHPPAENATSSTSHPPKPPQ